MAVFGEDRVIFGSDWPNSDGVAPVDKVFAIAKEYFATRAEGGRREVLLEELDRRVQVDSSRLVSAGSLMLTLVVRAAVWAAAFLLCASLEKSAGSSFTDLRQRTAGLDRAGAHLGGSRPRAVEYALAEQGVVSCERSARHCCACSRSSSLASAVAARGQGARGTKAVPLFNGKTLDGWEGDLKIFRVEDGAIVAGTLDNKIARNEFLCTSKTYGDFELRLKVKLLGGDGANAGIQFRTKRIPNHHEVSGYQADMGVGWWGALYDESRRNKVLTGPDQAKMKGVVKTGEWNDYVIRAEGKRIQLWINGVSDRGLHRGGSDDRGDRRHLPCKSTAARRARRGTRTSRSRPSRSSSEICLAGTCT